MGTEPAPKYALRELASEEYQVLLNTPPFNTFGLPDAQSSRVLIAQAPDGTVIGYWFLHAALHVEPFWLHPEHGSPQLARRMWDGIRAMMEQSQAPVAHAIIMDEDLVTAGMARRLGFSPVPGRLYWVTTKPQNGDAPPALPQEES